MTICTNINKTTIITILIIPFTICLSSFGQVNDKAGVKNEAVTDSTEFSIDLKNVELPPLQIFLETAYNSPNVEMIRAFKREQENRLKLIKNEWANYIRGVGNYSYGSMGSMSETSATGQSTYFQYFGETMSLYNVGVGITLPIDLIVNRKTKIKVQENEIEQANYQLLQAIENRKIQIIDIYSVARRNLDLLKVAQEASTIANSSIELAELEYINGKIKLETLNIIKRNQTLAEYSLQDAKSELLSAIIKLEQLTLIKIIK